VNLKRFLGYFMRTQSAAPDETAIRFMLGDLEFLSIQTVEFDVASNKWTVRLSQSAA
jgi:hypothetical protein